MDRVILLADHQIGYQIASFLLKNQEKGNFKLVKIFYNKNPNSWWPSIESLQDANNTNLINEFQKEKSFNEIIDINADYLLLISWKFLIKNKIINSVKKNVLNLHYSLLPKHRGINPVNWTIISNDKYAGITFHLVTQQIDAGDIISQRNIPISIDETTFGLLQKLNTLAFNEFKKIWKERKRWDELSLKQTESSSYHSKKDFEEICQLDLNKKDTIENILKLLLGLNFNDKSSAFFIDENKKKYSVHIKLTEIDE